MIRRKCADWEIAYIQRAVRLRARLTNKALAAKFKISRNTVGEYIKDCPAKERRCHK